MKKTLLIVFLGGYTLVCVGLMLYMFMLKIQAGAELNKAQHIILGLEKENTTLKEELELLRVSQKTIIQDTLTK